MPKINKIQLFYPSTDYAQSIHSGVIPPLGLLSISSQIRKQYPDIEIEILDGEINNSLINKIQADLIGISVNQYNYPNALAIAKIAKQKHAIVVLGGPHVNYLPIEILNNRPFVDYIVIFQGEKTFPLLIEGLIEGYNLGNVKNLVFRGKQKIEIEEIPMDETGEIDFNLVRTQLPVYYKNFKNKFPEISCQKPLPFYTQKGCQWGKCIFCSQKCINYNVKNPIKAADELESLIKEWGADYIVDMADNDFLSNLKWVNLFHNELKKRKLSPKFKIEARVDRITPETARLLRSIGVYEVFIGYESGNQDSLNIIRKGFTIKQSRNSVEFLNKEGINIIAGFMVGIPNETEDRLDDTVEFAKAISRFDNVKSVIASILTPRPGSLYFDKLLKKPEMKEKYKGKDLINIEEILKDAVHLFCKVEYAKLKKAINEICKNFTYRAVVGINFKSLKL